MSHLLDETFHEFCHEGLCLLDIRKAAARDLSGIGGESIGYWNPRNT